MLRYALFDLDETLYPTTNGLMQTIGERMRLYIMQRYGLPAEEAYALQKQYWREYGTTLRGLYIERHIDPEEYLRFVHDVSVRDFVTPDPKLRAVLEGIPLRKAIVTNADAPHARRVLKVLGLADLFAQIFDIVSFGYVCKPATEVYEYVLKQLGARGDECVLVEDMARNLPTARALGIRTILLGAAGESDEHIQSIYEVADAIARLG
ncbi:MAG: pyrimidine 5'-nucleotidase [Anaerolineae bacterium]